MSQQAPDADALDRDVIEKRAAEDDEVAAIYRAYLEFYADEGADSS